MAAGEAVAGSYCTVADPTSTRSTCTPWSRWRALETARTQWPQDMPSIFIVSRSMGVLSCVESDRDQANTPSPYLQAAGRAKGARCRSAPQLPVGVQQAVEPRQHEEDEPAGEHE